MKASTGMPGVSLTSPRRLDFLGGHADADEIIALAGALVGRCIRGDTVNGAVELGRGACVEGREAQHDRLAELNLIDVFGIDFDFDQ